jgi:acetyl/propionyl-CoA carboxylase alpha subunit/acetyl-CoA carboxylase carboxyltransferase component
VFRKLLIANRGEIALRIARTAGERGIATVMVFSTDDAGSAHASFGAVSHSLPGRGAAAYLDIAAIVQAAGAHGCDALHPGYGFLSENSALASACADAGIAFVGPPADQLALFGDKTRALALARECNVPVIAGTPGPVTLDEARSFLDQHGAIMLKALAGGGGRGMRAVERGGDLADAYARCRSEAQRAFGADGVYAERLIRDARHIEVQIIGDGDAVAHLGTRECTLQREHQKLVEIAPAPGLPAELRDRLLDAACAMAAASRYRGIGTFEFLVDRDDGSFAFIEANPRLQVEHTVTEEVMGCDLVGIQLDIAAGSSLAGVGLTQAEIGHPRGFAVQLRVNMETMGPDGAPRPGSGTIAAFDPPGGPGVRVDHFGKVGYEPATGFDSLLAKLIVSAPGGFEAAIARARRALGEFRIDGLPTNLAFLRALLARPEVAANDVSTRFVADHMAQLLAAIPAAETQPPAAGSGDWNGWAVLYAPMTGVLAAVTVAEGEDVGEGAQLAVLETMKLEHVLRAETGGVVRAILQPAGAQVKEGEALLVIEPREIAGGEQALAAGADPDHIRDDLAAVRARQSRTLDESRPAAVERRRGRGQRTARENIADLLDSGSFAEYGQLAVAYRHSRFSADELLDTSPADGFVAGIGTVNAERYGGQAASVAVGAYDATVMAGTLGHMNHKKADRLFDLAKERRIPLVLFAEGGGGRPREDPVTITGLNSPTFFKMARLSGKVPTVAIVSGRCFAANAALAGLADVVIATRDSTIGMAGPALIEAAGLGTFTPEEVGPIDVQTRGGVVDIAVADEAEAVVAARRYLSYFQGADAEWTAHDPRLLRHAVPESRLRAYDVREVGQLIADAGSWLELRAAFGKAYVTALARIEGRPVGVIANNPLFNAGAIDSPAADKAARFLRLCDAYGLPVLSLIDTPGIMVGPEAEATGLVRRSARMFAAAAALRVPMFAVVLRKAYGLGGAAAAGGYFQAPFFTVSWPTGELGGMGLEGSVRLGYKRELDAIADPAERQKHFEARVAKRYEKGQASFVASFFEVDAVIDPAETRNWLVRGLDATASQTHRWQGGFIDTW